MTLIALSWVSQPASLVMANPATTNPATTTATTAAVAPTRVVSPVGSSVQHLVKTPYLGALRYLVHLPPGGLPKAGRLPLLILLHGLGGSPENWLTSAGVGKRIDDAIRRGDLPACLTVIPQGDSGYWADWVDGRHPWATWLTGALLKDVRRRYAILPGAKNVAIVGASMGGFGALSAALRHPDRFGFVVSLSGTDVDLATRAQPHRGAYTRIWGEPIQCDKVARVNPWQLVRGGAGRKDQRFLLGWGSREPAKFAKGGARLARALRARGLSVAVRKVRGKGHGWASAWAPLQGWWIKALGRWWATPPAKNRPNRQ